jgi:hypothetical protein
LNRTWGPRCKFHGIKLDFEFFFNRKIPWTGLTVRWTTTERLSMGPWDHGRRRPKGSPELALGAAPVSGSLSAVGEKEEEASGVPTVGEGGWCGVEGRPTMGDRNGGGLELGVGRVEARRGEIRVGRGVVGCCGARGSFYRAGGREGRRCGEGNGGRRRCTFKAFILSVLGGERRDEWGVKGGGMRCHFRERRGRRGSGSARGRWRRWCSVGLPEEEDGRAH